MALEGAALAVAHAELDALERALDAAALCASVTPPAPGQRCCRCRFPLPVLIPKQLDLG